MRPGIVAALPGEARALARLRALGRAQLPGGGRLALSGIGAARARATARVLVAEGVDALVSWGSAAALAPALAPGDLLLSRTVLAADGRSFATDMNWRATVAAAVAGRVRIREGTLVESVEVIADVAAKQRLQERTGAAACDMESAAIAAVAADFGLPFIVIRAVVDDANMALPPAARAAVDEAGALRPLSLMWTLAGRPRAMHAQLRALKQISVAFRAARLTLAAVAPVLRDGPGA